MLGLQRRGRRVLRMCRSLFCRGRSGGHSTLAAVIADMVHRGYVDDRLAVNIGDVRDVHVIHAGVVAEGSVVPISAPIADATITKAVVDATIEADLRTPVAFIPGEGAVAPTPITRSPEQANGGRLDPCTRHPEVAFIPVRPVAGRPQKTRGRDHRLRVNRQGRRSDCDRHAHAELREQGVRDGHY